MFRSLLKSKKIIKVFRDHHLDETDELFIQELFGGPLDAETGLPLRKDFDIDANNWPYKGRPQEKSFLYEIVANKISGIDVDKFDYLLRDGKNFNIKARYFDYKRYFQFSTVVTGEKGLLTIAVPIKEKDLVEVSTEC